MESTNTIKVLNEDTEYSQIQLSSCGQLLMIDSKDKDGSIYLEFTEDEIAPGIPGQLCFNQDQIKALIKFLQTQIIQE